MNWTPVGTVVAAIVGALIAGYFGGRNGRKTPHDNLKALVDIQKGLLDIRASLPADLDDHVVIGKAIRRELAQIEALSNAHDISAARYVGTWLVQNQVRVEIVSLLAATAALSVLVFFPPSLSRHAFVVFHLSSLSFIVATIVLILALRRAARSAKAAAAEK